MGRILNKANTRINLLTIELMDIKPTDHVLDIGFGGGVTIPQISKLAYNGKTCGVDFSEPMVRQGEKKFRRLIEQGRVELRLGDIACLPYQDNIFDKVCSVNAIYFWTNPLENLLEIRRIMKKDGRLVVSFHSREKMKKMRIFQYNFSLYSPEEVRGLLNRAGFKNVRIETRDEDQRRDVIM
ncbi:MAG: class I SAM-dependent methyltransferase, partial [Thermodesulfobacteriota bacterium]